MCGGRRKEEGGESAGSVLCVHLFHWTHDSNTLPNKSSHSLKGIYLCISFIKKKIVTWKFEEKYTKLCHLAFFLSQTLILKKKIPKEDVSILIYLLRALCTKAFR